MARLSAAKKAEWKVSSLAERMAATMAKKTVVTKDLVGA
jgi:hypothetical protein